MSYSSFINNPELQLQSYSLVNANLLFHLRLTLPIN